MTNDSLLQGNVLAEIKWSPSVDGAHIGVTAKDGVITLTGQVAHYTEKFAAETATKSVYGVMGIANDIKVQSFESGKRSDQDIAEAAVSALKWDFEIPKGKVKGTDVKSKIEEAFRRNADLEARRITVDSYDGIVTLSGTVSSWYGREQAVSSAWSAPGVMSVKDNLTISL